MTTKISTKSITSDISGSFANMLGGKPDKSIVFDKNKRLVLILKRLSDVLTKFGKSQAMLNSFPEMKEEFLQINEFGISISRLVPDTKLSLDNSPEIYNEIKNHNISLKIVNTLSKLSLFKKNIGDRDNLSDVFILREPGIELKLFTFSDLCLKRMWIKDDFEKSGKTFVLAIINIIYTNMMKLHEIFTDPDVDINVVSEDLIIAITKAKSQIPRCDDAFRRIANSVTLMKQNFKGYYNDFQRSGNQNVMFEGFLLDVAKQQKKSATLSRQFKQIIKFFQEQSQKMKGKKSSMDPQLRNMFNILNDSVDKLADSTSVKVENDDESEDKKEPDEPKKPKKRNRRHKKK